MPLHVIMAFQNKVVWICICVPPSSSFLDWISFGIGSKASCYLPYYHEFMIIIWLISKKIFFIKMHDMNKLHKESTYHFISVLQSLKSILTCIWLIFPYIIICWLNHSYCYSLSVTLYNLIHDILLWHALLHHTRNKCITY